jgi:DNA N-6-adenine-methyltransferase (Dam)
MADSAALFSSESQCWLTPPSVLERILAFEPRGISLDPCGNVDSVLNAKEQWLIERGEDGLSRDWPADGLIFINPPFNEAERWAAKTAAESARKREAILLLPARTDTFAYQRHILPSCSALCMWKGRIQFGAGRSSGKQGELFGGEPATISTGENTATFATLFSYFGTRSSQFVRAFEPAGWSVVVR